MKHDVEVSSTRRLLMVTAGEVGHRSDPGHHCHTISALLQVDPEHDNQARRRLAILAVETAGLGRAVASHDRRTAQPVTASEPFRAASALSLGPRE